MSPGTLANPTTLGPTVDQPTTSRIWIACDNLWCGGAERAAVHLANSFRDEGCEVHVHCLHDVDGQYATRLHHEIDLTGSDDVADSVQEATELLREWQPDAYIVNHSTGSLAVAVARKRDGLLRCPVGVVVHAPRLWGDMFKHAMIHEVVDCFFAVSSEIADWMREIGVPPGKVRQIPNLVDADEFRPATGANEPGPPRFGYVGRMAPEKRPHAIVRAFAAYQRHHGDDGARLYMIGGDDPHASAGGIEQYRETTARVEAQVQRAAVDLLPGTYYRVEAQEDIAHWYRRLDALVLASRFEGLPFVGIEAMMSGVPLIVPSVGQCAELVGARRERRTLSQHTVVEGQRGILYRPAWLSREDKGVEKALSQAMSAFRASHVDAGHRAEMSRLCREYALANYSLQTRGPELLDSIRGGLGMATPAAPIVHHAPDRRHFVVTGGAGFIGSHLVRRLAGLGHRVTVLDNLSTGDRANVAGISSAITLIEGDITSSQDVQLALRHCDGVFHLAARSSVPRSFEDPQETRRVNISGTENVLLAASRRPVVFASSSSIYGLADRPTTEDMVRDGAQLSPYAESKWRGDEMVRQSGGTALRFFNVYGPRQRDDSPYTGVVALFCRALLSGDTVTIHGDGLQSRGFIFVRDVVDALVAAMMREQAHGHAFNVGHPEPTSVWDMLMTIASLAKVDRPSIEMVERRLGDIRHSHPDISRAADVLGWRPKTTPRDGLRRTLAWYSRRRREEP